MKKDTVILIPSYEPDERLITLVDELLKLEYPIIVVNDGSKEKFDAIFDQVKDKVTYLKHPKNKGKGIALKHGFSYLTFDNLNCNYIITCDGDGQHAVKDIVRVDEKMHKTKETVFGVREFGKNTPHRSKVGNNMSRLWRTIVTKEYIQDDQCGLRGFPFKYLDDLISTQGGRYEYEMNIVSSFQMKKFSIYEIIIDTIYLDNNKSSHFHPGGDTFRIQRAIFSHCFPAVISMFITLGYWGVLILASDKLNLTFHYTVLCAITFYYCCIVGILSIFYPTKKMGKRTLMEAAFTSIRGVFIVGLCYLLHDILSLNGLLSLSIACILSVFINFVLAYIIHGFKYIRIKKEYRRNNG